MLGGRIRYVWDNKKNNRNRPSSGRRGGTIDADGAKGSRLRLRSECSGLAGHKAPYWSENTSFEREIEEVLHLSAVQQFVEKGRAAK